MTTILIPDDVDAPELGPAHPNPPAPGPRTVARWAERTGRPAWSVPARIGVFLLATVLYTWDLSRNGMANSFYTAAVKSGTESWKAAFFGSIDRASFITVDKPPAALWVQELSAKIFGFSSWSILVPEALAGVASVMILYRLVRKWAGDTAAVLASLVFALTPAAVLMFRFNNPDPLMTLLLLSGAAALWAAIETNRTRWLVLSGGLVGFAFLTKTLEAFIVLPAFALVYLWSAKPRLRRRVLGLGVLGISALATSAWWVAIVELWPASSRPYIGGSTDNSELNLIFGYNGFSRIFGSGGAGGGTGANFAGSPGWLRMFNDLLAGEISWLLPLTLVGLVAGLWATRRLPRTSTARAGWLLWGGWTLMFATLFSHAKGIFHPYYTVVMAPAVGALAGAGAVALWKLGRSDKRWAPVLPAAVAGSAIWAAVVLDRVPGYDSWLAPTVVVAGVVSALAILAVLLGLTRHRAVALVAGLVAGATLLAGPAAYSITTINTAYQGGGITAGPSTGGGLGGAGGPGGAPGGSGGGTHAGFGGPPSGLSGATTPTGARSGTAPSGARSGIRPTGARSGATATGTTGRPTGGTFGTATTGRGGSFGGAPGGGGGGTASASLIRYLEKHQGTATYLLAVQGSQTAAPYILATGKAVMAMGGFSGSDPTPTLAQFKKLVAEGEVHYVLVSSTGGGGPGGGGGTVSSVLTWVEAHGTKVSASAYGGSTSGGTLYYVSSSAAR